MLPTTPHLELATVAALGMASEARTHAAFAAAFGAGRAVVAVSDTLARWWVRHRHTGWLVRSRMDVEMAVDQLMKNHQLLAELTLNARIWARQNSAENLAEMLFDGDKTDFKV